MKKLFLALLLMICGCFQPIFAKYGFIDSGKFIDFKVDKGSELRYKIGTYEGTLTASCAGFPYQNRGITRDLVIPDSIVYQGARIPVVGIEDKAFEVYGLVTGYGEYKINVLDGTLTLPSALKFIGERSFTSNEMTGQLTIPNSVKTIGNDAFNSCESLTGSLIIPNTVESIGDGAFHYCKGLTGSLIIPNSVITIGEQAFQYCSGLTGSLTIGNSVTTIEKFAFYGCTGLTGSLTIPNSVTKIGDFAFEYCSGLKGTLTIGNSVETIGDSAFAKCGFSNIICEAGIPPLIESDNDAFVVTPDSYDESSVYLTPLYVPNESIKDYKIAYEWRNFKNILAIGTPFEKIVLNETNLELNVGESFQLKASILSENVIDITATWKSSDWSIAKVSADGTVTAISAGTAIITAKCGAATAICNVTVKPVVASNVMLDVEDKNLFVGQKYKLTAKVEPANTTNPDISWKSSDESIATVSEDGTVTAVSVGVAIVTATCGDVSAACKVTVKPVLASGVKLNVEDMTLLIGQSDKLSATVEPANTTNPDITWNSSDENIATVDNQGLVTAVSVGVATVTATCGDVSATCKVTVKPVAASGVKLNVENMTLLIGQSDKLSATVEPVNTTNPDITWKSSDESIAIVSADGTVTAVSVGVANITATCGDVTATCMVTVKPVVATDVKLNVEDITLFVGQSDKLSATVEPANTTYPDITWKSSDESIATVSADGTLTAVSVGVVNVTATCGEVTASCKVTVKPVMATGIALNVKDLSLLIGSTEKLTATVIPDNTTDKTVVWTTDKPEIATVSEDGTVTALAVGSATVTATCGEVSATCKISVTPISPTSIDLNIKDVVLYIGQSETIKAVVRPANTTYPTVTWKSENESVATISNDGTVTGITEGVTTITATCGNVSATCVVTVNPIPASNIEITTGNVTLTIGSTSVLIAKVSPENTTHPEVEWSSSDTNIATITDNGTVMAVNLGTAIITAKCGNVSATCTVNVIPVPSEGILISPTSVSMLLGDDVTLRATVFPENTTDKTVTWGSDNPAVASVSSNGVVTALKIGSATITARNGNASAECEVVVNPVVANSISLNVKDETIFVASSTQLVASISPENVTDKTITWTSSKPEIATVTDQGLVYGVSVGTTTIMATIGSVSTTCQINVVHRIPDMDPAVTTSDRDIVTKSGYPVNMAVYSEGGELSGWSYVWTKNGEVVSRSDKLNITAINKSKAVIAEKYRVKVENEIDKVVIFSEIFDFVVHIYPDIDGLSEDDEIIISTGNGSSNRTREGNTISLSITPPSGGFPDGWEYIWSDKQGVIGEGKTIETVATISTGNSMAIEKSSYNLRMTNYGPDGDIWGQFNLGASFDVYRRPETPMHMLRKGDGSSHTFIVMMPISDTQFEQLNYSLVYGWTDDKGVNHVIDRTHLRYCHTDVDVYDNPTNRFWVYSEWNYQDGCVVSSGLCYLDGSVDEDFDASVFDGSGVIKDTKGVARSSVYTIEGHYVGSDPSNLSPGIYIYTTEINGVKNTRKIIIR